MANEAILTDPALSRRCKDLLYDRNQKVALKQKIVSLIKRNEDILKRAPQNRTTALGRLKKSLNKLNQEKTITELEVQSMEENIIKQGCPGITLSE